MLVVVSTSAGNVILCSVDDGRKWSVEDEGSDLESNSSESEASSGELEDEGSDSDHQYQPSLGRNSFRAQGYTNTGKADEFSGTVPVICTLIQDPESKQLTLLSCGSSC